MIRQIEIDDLDDLIKLVRSNNTVLQENNRMFYFLSCTVFKKFSFIYFEQEQPIGFLIAFKDSYDKFIWIHQMAISPSFQGKGYGKKLAHYLLKTLKAADEGIDQVRLSVKRDNYAAKKLYSTLGFQFLKFEDSINMEIYFQFI